ncbi:thiosulfate sulfurtransferase GlpE [Methylocella sp.]|uniref:thiosulfate sulfurtransferase GlpE n=1 Tax=Methylocella sp. TaxID=1978226 RepID=UPI00378500C1
MERKSYRRVDVDGARAVMAQEGALVFDVRDPGSYGRGHIEGARHLTMDGLGEVIQKAPKAAPVVICCYHGNASQEYARILTDFGFQEVYSLDGGYEAWARKAG